MAPSLPVVVTRRFERAVEALLAYYEAVAHLHPDAGSRALEMIDAVELKLPTLLGNDPCIGRRAVLSRSQSDLEREWLRRLAPLTAGRRLEAREWHVEGFWILYHRTATAVYLASARHVRELGYR